MSSKYFERLNATLDAVVAKLTGKGIEPRHLAFGGEGEKPSQKPRVPTDARSEFLANRAMGDWAERMLTAALVAALPEWKVAHTATRTASRQGTRSLRRAISLVWKKRGYLGSALTCSCLQRALQQSPAAPATRLKRPQRAKRNRQ